MRANIARPRAQLKGSSGVTDLSGGLHLAFRNGVLQPERSLHCRLQQLESEMRGRDVPRRDRQPLQEAALEAPHPHDGPICLGDVIAFAERIAEMSHGRAQLSLSSTLGTQDFPCGLSSSPREMTRK